MQQIEISGQRAKVGSMIVGFGVQSTSASVITPRSPMQQMKISGQRARVGSMIAVGFGVPSRLSVNVAVRSCAVFSRLGSVKKR